MCGKTFYYLFASILVSFLMVAPSPAQDPSTPTLTYQWVKGRPGDASITLPYQATIRVRMSGDVAPPTSPTILLAGFNLAMTYPDGAISSASVSMSNPEDANAQDNNGTQTELTTEYRFFPDAYTSGTFTADEFNVMRWDNGFFVVGSPTSSAGFTRVTLSGIYDIFRTFPGPISFESISNLVTDAGPFLPANAGGTSPNTEEENKDKMAAVLDILFTVSDPSLLSGPEDVQILPNQNASEVLAVVDNDAPMDPPRSVPVESGKFVLNPNLLDSFIRDWNSLEE